MDDHTNEKVDAISQIFVVQGDHFVSIDFNWCYVEQIAFGNVAMVVSYTGDLVDCRWWRSEKNSLSVFNGA